MVIRPVVEATFASFTPPAAALQLLANLGVIRDNLGELGEGDVVGRLDWVLGEEERLVVFRGCWGAGGGCAGCVYAPKAEVEFFCEEIEPRILVFRDPFIIPGNLAKVPRDPGNWGVFH